MLKKHQEILKMRVDVLNSKEKVMRVKDVEQGTVFFDSTDTVYFKTAEMTLENGKVVSQVCVITEDARSSIRSGDPAFLDPDQEVTALVD